MLLNFAAILRHAHTYSVDPRKSLPNENLWGHSNFQRTNLTLLFCNKNYDQSIGNFSEKAFGSITLRHSVALSEADKQLQQQQPKIDFDFNQSNFIMVFLITFFSFSSLLARFFDFNISHFNIIFFIFCLFHRICQNLG